MSTRRVVGGSTNVSVTIRIIDSTDGTPETGVVFNTTGIDLWYRREGAASVDIVEATLAALTTAHTDGGFLHINDGWYRLDLPDAAVAGGVAGVQIGGTVTGMIVLAPYIELETALNNLSAADVNAQVLDVLNTDTFAEPTGVPGATVSLAEKIGRIYQALRNRVDVTATKKTFRNDAGTAIWEKDLSDNGTTYSESEGNAI